jgi:hypothetical protein
VGGRAAGSRLPAARAVAAAARRVRAVLLPVRCAADVTRGPAVSGGRLAALAIPPQDITEASASLYRDGTGGVTAFVAFAGIGLSVLIEDPDAADQIAAAFTAAAGLLREAKAGPS